MLQDDVSSGHSGLKPAAHLGVNQGWLLWFCLYFFFGVKLSLPKRVHSELTRAVVAALFLKNAERGASAV